MAYAEKRGNLWRARWVSPSGKLESQSGFKTRKAAEDYANDKESSVRKNTYVDVRAGQVTVAEIANAWYSGLDLEPTTMSNYRYMTEVYILPKFGDRAVASLTEHEMPIWERELVTGGLSRRSASDARSTFATILASAVPRYIQINPAARKKGTGRKGTRRIEKMQQRQKVWASPLDALLIAERAAALSGQDTDFVMAITIAYTGMRWGEAIGLMPDCVGKNKIDVHWKLYELNGRFYRGRPKDGSMRTLDLPPFLSTMLSEYMRLNPPRTCSCSLKATDTGEIPWCAGDAYVFLGAQRGHFRRSNYSERVFRPAADGWHPARRGSSPRARKPVLVDASQPWPGSPLAPWPAAISGELPGARGRGIVPVPAEMPVASWLPILPDLTPHGLRHGHHTWMDEAGVSYVLQSERMGHEVPGMRGVYNHVSPMMRSALISAMERLWGDSLRLRSQLSPQSSVPILNRLLHPRGNSTSNTSFVQVRPTEEDIHAKKHSDDAPVRIPLLAYTQH